MPFSGAMVGPTPSSTVPSHWSKPTEFCLALGRLLEVPAQDCVIPVATNATKLYALRTPPTKTTLS